MADKRPEKQECGECDCCKRLTWEYNLACDISYQRKERVRELESALRKIYTLAHGCSVCADVWYIAGVAIGEVEPEDEDGTSS